MGILTGKHIFIVEDDSVNRLVFRMSLSKQGARVDFDAGGQGAIALLTRLSTVDLIVLDLMLVRGHSGLDLFDRIRALPGFATIPIVAVSATDPGTGMATTRAKGFNGFISKPIDSARLPHQLAHILSGHTLWHTDYFDA